MLAHRPRHRLRLHVTSSEPARMIVRSAAQPGARQGPCPPRPTARPGLTAGPAVGARHALGRVRRRGAPPVAGGGGERAGGRRPGIRRAVAVLGRVRRGEIWTASGGDYAGELCPVVIVQDDRFDATASITVCAFTTDPTEAPLFRPVVEPSAAQRAALGLPPDGGQDHDGAEGPGSAPTSAN